jgi:hypothetical protein
MTFTETDHPRTSQGMFADKMQSAPEATLSPAADLNDDASWAGVGPQAAADRYYSSAAGDFVHRFTRTGLGNQLTRTLTLPATDRVGTQTLRAAFHRSALDSNLDFATVEVWTPAGWVEVVKTVKHDFPEAPSIRETDDACQSFAEDYLQERCLEAARIIG